MQVLFRDVNDGLRESFGGFEALLPGIEFVCECGALSCLEPVELTSEEYTAVRRIPGRFIVAPGCPNVDPREVVERRASYWLVAASERRSAA